MSFLSVLFIHFCALLTPGPDFFIVTTYAVKTDFKKALFVVFGVSVAICLWVLASLNGLNLIFATFPILRTILSVLGGIYLLYLAFLILKSLKNQSHFTECSIYNNPFMAGFITNISNVKSLFYFVSIFSSLNLNLNLAIVALVLMLESFIYFAFVALLFSNVKIKAIYIKHSKKLDVASAVVFTFFALFIFVIIFQEFING